MLQEFKKFAIKGNMLDMAVGIVIGAAFATIVSSLVGDVLMPVIGLLTGGADFSDLFLVLRQGDPAGPYVTLSAARDAGAVTLNWGVFTNALVNFLIVALALFLVVRAYNRFERQEEAAPAAPEGPTQKELLVQIRDLLEQRD